MTALLLWALQNTMVAILLALGVAIVARVWRHPPVVHLLWLLVLVKLVSPPLVPIDWPALGLPALALVAPNQSFQVDEHAAQTVGPNSTAEAPPIVRDQERSFAILEIPAGDAWNFTKLDHWVGPVADGVGFVWLVGAVLLATVNSLRIVRFQRQLRGMFAAADHVQRLAAEAAGRIGLFKAPEVRVTEGVAVPFLWCVGRTPLIVLPAGLLRDLDDERLTLILAHELAHLRRRDHWVRMVELAVSTVCWWNPLVPVIRRQLHRAEELCCDAWVRWAFPERRKSYAEVLLYAAESCYAAPSTSRFLPVSPFLDSPSLKARIEMLLHSQFAPRVSTRSLLLLACGALVVLPSLTIVTRAEGAPNVSETVSNESREAAKPATTSEFPHVVPFEQGATKFLDGDQITITEIRGTAATFAPGNIYWIKGSYTLASRDSAILLASVTAVVVEPHQLLHDFAARSDHVAHGQPQGTDPGRATGVEFKVQRTNIARGTGTFTLFLPMSYQGLPHVSLYSLDKGEGFGGNYFGTGESTLKQWWHSRDPKQAKATMPAPLPDVEKADISHPVRFEQGATRFLDGDNVTITEIQGTSDTFSPGNVYRIKGTYKLTSRDRAALSAFTTAREAKDGYGPTKEVQTTITERGEGTFTLILPMSCRGWPHISFYPAEGGGDFGGNYFGTGDSVLRHWWGSKETD